MSMAVAMEMVRFSIFQAPGINKFHVKCPLSVKASQTFNISSPPADCKTKKIRRPQNVDGDFFVDNTCTDCDACRWMAPETFKRLDGMSAVFKQPTCDQERKKALQALLSCPTSSIRTEKPPSDILDVQKTFPIPIDDQKIQGVYHCGYHSKKSYGGASYFITRPEGNILIDSPRYTEKLASIIRKMGGARYMFLTHRQAIKIENAFHFSLDANFYFGFRDDVADHDKWSKELGCPRILHLDEVNPSTADVEMKLEGSGPWTLGSDITLIHTPGHTEGSVCLFYKTKKVLFSGDHFMMNEFGLTINEKYNWFSVPMQLKSVQKLLELDFEWILPGHGRRARFEDVEDKNLALKTFLAANGIQA